MNPQLSVILPVYNAERFLQEAIMTVLGQTFSNFELLVINDGSSDGSLSLIQGIHDPRIRVLSSPQNFGLVHALNWGVAEARGHWIARMDADDICHPERFERQLDYLNRHPSIDVLGTSAREIDEQGNVLRPLKRPAEHQYIACEMLFRCVMIHPTVMGRAEVFKRIPYRPGPAEDYRIWIEMLENGVQFANMSEPMLDYRIHGSNATKTHLDEHLNGMQVAQRDYLSRLLALKVRDQDFQSHKLLFAIPEEIPQGRVNWKELRSWVKTLIEANEREKVLDSTAWLATIFMAWCSLAKKTNALEWDAIPRHFPHPIHSAPYFLNYLQPQ